MIERDIPSRLLETVKSEDHHHETHSEDTPRAKRKKR